MKLENAKKQALLICLSSSIITICCHVAFVILQALAALNLAWCHEHDLINFVWGFYFIYSFGSFMADLGVLMNLSTTKSPPWNVALGTPILIFAGLAHVFQDCFVNYWKERKGEPPEFPHGEREA